MAELVPLDGIPREIVLAALLDATAPDPGADPSQPTSFTPTMARRLLEEVGEGGTINRVYGRTLGGIEFVDGALDPGWFDEVHYQGSAEAIVGSLREVTSWRDGIRVCTDLTMLVRIAQRNKRLHECAAGGGDQSPSSTED